MRECDDWRNKGYSFFQNKQCEYFPCHTDISPENFNCLFCFCPLYHTDNCGGGYIILNNGKKDCGGCNIPHIRENYGHVIDKLV